MIPRVLAALCSARHPFAGRMDPSDFFMIVTEFIYVDVTTKRISSWTILAIGKQKERTQCEEKQTYSVSY